ncbi:MAG: homoserine dehydrogenase [Clostridia bacterium]|nr:homoserine dehydrogenase [Clostridia bacterium]
MKKIAILGFGVVGSGVAEVLTQNKDIIEKKLGESIEIKYILDLRDFPDSPFADKVIHDFNLILNDPEISIVAEMMGGSHPAYDFSKASLLAGKSVVTSNKEVVSKFGAELLALARQNNVRYLFEASVGGGIPIIRPLNNDLTANKIICIDGILNGTTNYILTQMNENGTSFADALCDAQKKGYAEADPTADIEGIDAARKICILSSLSFGKCISADRINRKGITKITADDFEVAKALGYTIKLIGHSELIDGKIYADVSPRFVPLTNPLAHISDVYNGVLVGANMLDKVLFYGKGAGKLPTASAVVADIIDIAEKMKAPQLPIISWNDADDTDIADINSYLCKRCIILGGERDDAIYLDKLDKSVIITEDISHNDCLTIAERFKTEYTVYPIL